MKIAQVIEIADFNKRKFVDASSDGISLLLEAYRNYDLFRALEREYNVLDNQIYMKELERKRKKEKMMLYSAKALKKFKKSGEAGNIEAIKCLKDLYPEDFEQTEFDFKEGE